MYYLDRTKGLRGSRSLLLFPSRKEYLLGPVADAQQVLDPSPQTSHPRKEKGGGTSAVAKSRYMPTSSGFLERSFIFSS